MTSAALEGGVVDVVRALFVTLAALVTIYVARWWMALSRSRSLPPGALERAATPGLTHGAIAGNTKLLPPPQQRAKNAYKGIMPSRLPLRLVGSPFDVRRSIASTPPTCPPSP